MKGLDAVVLIKQVLGTAEAVFQEKGIASFINLEPKYHPFAVSGGTFGPTGVLITVEEGLHAIFSKVWEIPRLQSRGGPEDIALVVGTEKLEKLF